MEHGPRTFLYLNSIVTSSRTTPRFRPLPAMMPIDLKIHDYARKMPTTIDGLSLNTFPCCTLVSDVGTRKAFTPPRRETAAFTPPPRRAASRLMTPPAQKAAAAAMKEIDDARFRARREPALQAAADAATAPANARACDKLADDYGHASF